MITGTSYFPNLNAAQMYYRTTEQVTYDVAGEIVQRKLNEGLIHIGKPPIKISEKLFIRDNRYFIEG
jgi:hypothetical protein